VKKGVPFREAHEIVGKLVAKQVLLNQIALAELKKFSPLFDVDLASVFDVRGSLAGRTAPGAPSPDNIALQVKRWRKLLK
jgi:argininosuccinate lyase